MVWVIFALGAALCAAGGAAIVSGLSYMPVEWGWSQLIAGTTAVSAGIVTLALAALLFRLGSIHRTLREAAIRRDEPSEAQAVPEASPEPEAVAEPEPEPEPMPAAARPEPEPVRNDPADEPPRSDHADAVVLSVEPRSGPPDPVGEVRLDAGEPEHASPADVRRDLEAEEAPPIRIVERDSRPKPVGWARRLAARRAGQEGLPPPPLALPDLAPPPWASDDLEGGPPTTRSVETRAGRAGGSERAVDLVPTERPGPDIADSIAPASVPRPPANGSGLGEAAPDASVTEAPGEAVPPTIVGRYQAGGASYALFSDGTIEVETETGTHRFGSMDDLKRFLERQDETSRPGWPG